MVKKSDNSKKTVPNSDNKTKQSKPKRQKKHGIKEYTKAIQQSNGILVNIAEMLGVTRGTVTCYLNEHPELRELVNQKRESWIDKAEDELFNQIDFIDHDDPVPAARIRQNAAQYILSRLGKDRGYVEKTQNETEVTHKGEGFKLIIENPKDDERD